MNAMKPGIILLIIGGVVLGAGLAIASFSTFSVTRQVLEGSINIDETLEPNFSIIAELIDLPQGQQLLLSLSADPSDAPLQARITGPDETTLVRYNITNTPFTGTTRTEMSGNHTLEITNVGSRTVTISGTLFSAPIGSQDGAGTGENAMIQSFVNYGIGILAGIALIVAGIVLLIIGAIKYIRGRRSAPPSAAQ